MVIVADSSVWIDSFNQQDSPSSRLLASSIQNGTIIIGDIIMMEILRGFRSDTRYREALEMLESIGITAFLGQDNAIRSAQNYRIFRKKGITIRKSADVVIATYCIKNNLPLLYNDRDFDPFVEELGLMRA
jgi:predicted nucleic acid-binding protein